jgi:uncharacterized membrane protein YqjE
MLRPLMMQNCPRSKCLNSLNVGEPDGMADLPGRLRWPPATGQLRERSSTGHVRAARGGVEARIHSFERRTVVVEHTADTARSPGQDRSTGELVKQLSEQVTVLIRDELKLAQLEMTRKGKQAGVGAGLLGGSGVVSLYGVGCLIACAIIAISGVVAAWLAALIVGAVLLALAGVGALIGKGRLQKATPPVPEQAVDSVKTDVEEIKERARR